MRTKGILLDWNTTKRTPKPWRTDSRDEFHNRKRQTSSNGRVHEEAQRRCTSRKSMRPQSISTLVQQVKLFLCMKKFWTEKKRMLLQKPKFQQKRSRLFIKRNRAQWTMSPEINLKETEIYELFSKEFKISDNKKPSEIKDKHRWTMKSRK